MFPTTPAQKSTSQGIRCIMAYSGIQLSDPLQQPGSSSQATNVAPRLQEPFQMSNDMTMRDTPEFGLGSSREGESTEDEADSMTDESSINEEHEVPRGLPVSKLPTGLCYDDRMRFHSEVSAPTGDSVHPEDPRRIYYIYKELCEAGLVENDEKHPPLVDPPLKRINAREATREEICLVHTGPHYDFVQKTSGKLVEI